jgi:hypothetical protein
MATKGHIRHRLPDRQAWMGPAGREEGRFFLCVLCVLLWQWRFVASLLLGLAKGEHGSLGGLMQVVDFHDRFRYF